MMNIDEAENWLCIGSLATTILSYKGYDDAIYPRIEAEKKGIYTQGACWADFIFTMSKFFASTFGGVVIATEIELLLQNMYSISFSYQQTKYLWAFCFIVTWGLFGVLQNIIRYSQGRKIRSTFEIEKIKHNINSYRHKSGE